MSQSRAGVRGQRRWFSYRLRSLLAFVAVLSVGLAWVASERRQSERELQIAKELEARGATVHLCGAFDVPSTRLLQPIWDTRLLEFLRVEEDPRADQSWWRTALGRLLGQRVEGVVANHLDPPLDDLKLLADLENLKSLYLDLAHGEAEPDEEAPRQQLVDLAPLAGLKNLEYLVLDEVPVADLSPLAGLKKLEYLSLRDSKTVRDISPLAGLERLEEIWLDGNPISDLSPLAGLKRLNTLHLSLTNVSDLSPLASCKNLAILDINGAPVGDSQIELLQLALPKCQIDYKLREARQ